MLLGVARTLIAVEQSTEIVTQLSKPLLRPLILRPEPLRHPLFLAV
jgi:hypothetical protein